ncbi:phage tail protein [Clostridium perfringens]
MTVPNFLRENTELKLKKLNKVDEFGAYFSIPFVTDVHNAETTTYKWLNSIRVIEEVNKRKNINYILTGGDYINNHDDKEEVIKRLKNFKDRFEDRSNLFITLGNHDDNSNYKDFSKVITHSEMKKIMFSDMQDVTLGNGLYYYKDFHEHKIRLIVLNSEDIPEYDIGMKYKGQWDYAFSNEQLNWVAHTALNTDYKIIFCSHTPMVENVEGFDYPIKNAEAMLGIMKAYTLGESYSGSNTTGNFKYNVSVDYNKKGTIVCCLFGHVHADNIVYKDNIAHISTTCSNCSYRYGSSHVENATGTVNEIALDFLTVRNDMGFLTRFGAGSDRSFTYVNNTKESKKEKSYPGIKLLGQNKKIIALLQNLKDLSIESILESGDKTLSFSYAKDDKFYENIIEENYIRTKEDEFVIKSRDIGVDYTRFDCVLNLEELEANVFDRFESVEQTITNALNLAIVGTEWTVNDNTLKKKRTVRCTNKNALEIVKEIKKTYRVDIVFNTLEKKIEIYEKLGEDKGAYFIDSLNLTALQVQSDSYKFSTRIIAEGKDNLTFEDINGGKNYVENFQYSKKIKTIYWKDERYTIKESLLEDAKAKLEEISKPFTSYNASVLNLAELNPKYKSILDYSLGDTITLLSKSNKVRDKQRIVKTVEYPQDHSRDTVELANAILKFEDIQQENQETTDTVNNITTDNGTVDGSTIDSIQVKQIEDFKANVIEVVNLKAINASINNLHANKADIQDLNAVKAKIGTLEATKANITQLNAVSAEISKLDTLKANIVDLNSATAKIGVLEAKTASIDNLLSQKASINDLNALNATISEALIKKATIAQLEALETKTNNLIADKANIKDLNVTNANINKIQAETANIKTLLNGNLSSENIQAGGITSDKLTIANGFITNLMISSVSASKITAGTIDAAKINVVNLNADNLTVGKINGQLLKDGSISGLAIENGAIDNNKVSPNANIEASKINISSVVTAINEGSTLLTANKVTIDSEKGTLDVAFNNLNTSLEANKKITESNSTAINVVQGKLSASIENSKVLEGKQKTLEDNYNRTVITVDSLKNTVGQQKTLIDSATGKITSVEVKANTLEKNLSGLTQTVTDTKKVIENNKTILESKNAELKANIDKVSSSLSSVSSTVDKNNKTLLSKTNTLEQTLFGLTQTVSSNKATTDGKISSVENVTHELKAGLGGLTSKLDTLKSTTDGINKTVSNQGSVINQLKDSIKLKVDSSTFTQSTQTINSNINKAKEDAINTANNNTTNAINRINIGGRNLALNSSRFELPVRNTGTASDNYNYISIDANLLLNSEYTISANVEIVSGSIKEISIYDYPGGKCSRVPIINNRITYTFTKRSNTVNSVLLYAGLAGETRGNSVVFTNVMLEKGNKVTDWTPAPEDLQAYANEIAKAKADLAQANAIANADGKITVEEKKRIQQAQTNLNTAIAKATEAETKAKSYADSKKQEAINSANNAINNIKIGGRNYGLNTDVMQQEPYNIIFSKDLVFEKGKTYTISMDFDLENLVKGSQERVGCEGSILFKDGTRQYIGLWHWISQGATFKGRKSYTFTIENKDIKDNMTSIHIYTELVSSGKRNLGRFKIEEGNKATDYTIAPEDLQSYADKVAKAKADLAQANAIANADGKITEEERKRIQQAQENLNTAIARADKAKQDAINAASTDATNKTNNALNSAKAYVNAEITTVNTKVNNVESNINILKNKIESKVGQSDIDKSISAIKIGGRNLVQQSISKEYTGFSGRDNDCQFNYEVLLDTLNVGDTITVSFLFSYENLTLASNTGYGFRIQGSGDVVGWSDGAFPSFSFTDKIQFGPGKSGSFRVEYNYVLTSNSKKNTKWYPNIRTDKIQSGKMAIKEFMVEFGTKRTAYLPAPEDTDKLVADSIKVVDTKISDVSSKITQLKDSVTIDINSINSKTHAIETNLGGKASKQEVTEVNNRVATIKASLDSITQRVSSTESKTNSLETTVNGKASKQELTVVNNKVTEVTANLNGITQRVGNTESRINNLDGKLANTVTNQQFTEFKQSNDKFKFTVEQRSSVSNILPNSSFFGGDRGWLHNGAEFWSGPYSGYGFKGRMTGAIKNRAGYNNPERFLQTHKAYKVKKNTTYTISFHYACEMNIQSMEAYVVLSDTEHGDYAQPIRILEKPGGTQSDPNNEIPFTYKFNTGNHEWVWLRFDHNGMKPGTNWDQYCWLYVSEIGIYEGDVGAVKWTPKGGEVYSANYQMDGLGFKGTFEDGTYASLGKDGLEWYNAGTGHAYHALTYVTSFDIPVGNPGKAYIKLPVEFTKRKKSLKWTVALRGYYYSTSGDFFPFHVHCTGVRDYIENGLVVCEVQGYCKIQNAQNSGDVQFRPLTAMLIAIA